jgi:hypothetical protein
VSIRELRRLLDQVADTRELIVRRHTWSASYDAWCDAREEAREAYRTWRSAPTAEAYAVYRAAQDREDAAQDMLAQSHTSRSSVS